MYGPERCSHLHSLTNPLEYPNDGDGNPHQNSRTIRGNPFPMPHDRLDELK